MCCLRLQLRNLGLQLLLLLQQLGNLLVQLRLRRIFLLKQRELSFKLLVLFLLAFQLHL